MIPPQPGPIFLLISKNSVAWIFYSRHLLTYSFPSFSRESVFTWPCVLLPALPCLPSPGVPCFFTQSLPASLLVCALGLTQVSQEFPEGGPGSPLTPIRNTPEIGTLIFSQFPEKSMRAGLEDVREGNYQGGDGKKLAGAKT